MKKLIENKEKVKTILIIILLIVIAFLCLRVNFEKSTVARYRDKLNEKRCPSINHTNNNSTIEDTTPEKNNGVVEDPQKEKTKYEKILERYTFGDSHFDNWLSILFKEQLNDKNKLYITLNNSYLIRETTSLKCKELLPNLNIEDDRNSESIKVDGRTAYCEATNSQYDYEKLNAEYHSLFGKSSDLPKIKGIVSFSNISEYYPPVAYSDKMGGYVNLNYRGGGTRGPNKFYKIVDTKEEENKLTIEIKYKELPEPKHMSDDEFEEMFNDDSLKKYRFNFEKDSYKYYLKSIDG